MNPVEIKKAKIKDHIFLDVEYTESLPGHSKKGTKLSCTVPAHEDLLNSFSNLHRHLAILCDEVKTPKKGDFEHCEFPEFKARGFSIGGNGENAGVTISGHKEGKFGNVNLNTPFTRFENEEYPFAEQLSQDIQACIYEVEQYLFQGKKAPDQQLSMFEEELVEESQEA